MLGVEVVADIADLPDDAIDLVFVCTPAAANPDLLRACAKKGIRAAFLASAGYGEAGGEGQQLQAELVALAEELGMLVAGPNGQGVVSTPASLCAQIVAPYPPAGGIGIASPVGQLHLLVHELRGADGRGRQPGGVGRQRRRRHHPRLPRLLRRRTPPPTWPSPTWRACPMGAAFFERTRAVAATKPLVLVKGGATAGGQRAAASHTGSLATDDRVFDGMCRQAGITRAATIEEAFEAAATFATQPLPAGNRVVVLTTAGGWGVVTADAIARSSLDLTPLPDDLRAPLDGKLPPRWSRNNPVDLAGAETRDTIPEVIDLIVGHPEVDAVIYLGLGIQSNQAALMRSGPFYPDHGLERIVDYHERQDARFAQAAADASERYDKPVLTATELAVTHPTNAGPAAVRATGRLCYASANRAVTALDHLWRYARSPQARAA